MVRRDHRLDSPPEVVSSELIETSILLVRGHKDLTQKLDALEERYDIQFKAVFDAIRRLMAGPARRDAGSDSTRGSSDHSAQNGMSSSSAAAGAPTGGSSAAGAPRAASAPRPPPPRNCTRCAMISVM